MKAAQVIGVAQHKAIKHTTIIDSGPPYRAAVFSGVDQFVVHFVVRKEPLEVMNSRKQLSAFVQEKLWPQCPDQCHHDAEQQSLGKQDGRGSRRRKQWRTTVEVAQ